MRALVGHDSAYVALLMSTGLTFGTISSLYGLNAGIIDRFQFSVLLTVVIATAIIPTVIAQTWFQPEPVEGSESDRGRTRGSNSVDTRSYGRFPQQPARCSARRRDGAGLRRGVDPIARRIDSRIPDLDCGGEDGTGRRGGGVGVGRERQESPEGSGPNPTSCSGAGPSRARSFGLLSCASPISVVMGTRGLTRAKGVLMGSVSQAVSRRAKPKSSSSDRTLGSVPCVTLSGRRTKNHRWNQTPRGETAWRARTHAFGPTLRSKRPGAQWSGADRSGGHLAIVGEPRGVTQFGNLPLQAGKSLSVATTISPRPLPRRQSSEASQREDTPPSQAAREMSTRDPTECQ